jgi:hypothetical protein
MDLVREILKLIAAYKKGLLTAKETLARIEKLLV